jgi:hypothetical protein
MQGSVKNARRAFKGSDTLLSDCQFCLSVCLSVEVEVGLTCTVRAAERLHDTQGPIRADSV